MSDFSFSKFTAWASTEVSDDDIVYGEIAFIEPSEIKLIRKLSKSLSNKKDRAIILALYKRLS
tara:strand:- start:1246 stop:1434 length:189 start_codon:yes stop_codon:yes gene_type:complete